MSAKPYVIMPKTQSAAVSAYQVGGYSYPDSVVSSPVTTIMQSGLSGAEKININYSVDSGITWDALKSNGSDVVLSIDNPVISFYSPINLSFSKDVTAFPAGVFAATLGKV